MIALLDGDLLAYRCAASAERDSEEIALFRLEELIQNILEAVNATAHRTFIGGKNNFRKILYPEYKANRTSPKPIHLTACMDYLKTRWKAEWSYGLEADDMLGIHQTKDSIVVSIDKDLLQIPGNHYHFVNRELLYIDEKVGHQNFYKQLILGDKSDNIPGFDGLYRQAWPKKFMDMRHDIETMDDKEEMFDYVRNILGNDDNMLLYGQMLYIWRDYLDLWNPLKLVESTGKDRSELVRGHLSESTTIQGEEESLSLEPTMTGELGIQYLGPEQDTTGMTL